MSVRGADILEVVVRKGVVSTSAIAHELTGVYDGRKVAARTKKLAKAGLVELSNGVAKTTDRGCTVDATLARITAKRGGEFQPWNSTDMTTTEKLALGG